MGWSRKCMSLIRMAPKLSYACRLSMADLARCLCTEHSLICDRKQRGRVSAVVWKYARADAYRDADRAYFQTTALTRPRCFRSQINECSVDVSDHLCRICAVEARKRDTAKV